MEQVEFYVKDSNGQLFGAKFLKDRYGSNVVDPNWGRTFYNDDGSLNTNYSPQFYKLYAADGTQMTSQNASGYMIVPADYDFLQQLASQAALRNGGTIFNDSALSDALYFRPETGLGDLT